jgi:hypothetical protein
VTLCIVAMAAVELLLYRVGKGYGVKPRMGRFMRPCSAPDALDLHPQNGRGEIHQRNRLAPQGRRAFGYPVTRRAGTPLQSRAAVWRLRYSAAATRAAVFPPAFAMYATYLPLGDRVMPPAVKPKRILPPSGGVISRFSGRSSVATGWWNRVVAVVKRAVAAAITAIE